MVRLEALDQRQVLSRRPIRDPCRLRI